MMIFILSQAGFASCGKYGRFSNDGIFYEQGLPANNKFINGATEMCVNEKNLFMHNPMGAYFLGGFDMKNHFKSFPVRETILLLLQLNKFIH